MYLEYKCHRRVIFSSFVSFIFLIFTNSKAMISSLTPDDYLSMDINLPAGFFLQQGRFMQAIHAQAFRLLGIPISDAGVSAWILLFIGLSVCVSYSIDTIFDGKICGVRLAFVSTFIVSSPYFATLFVYRRTVIDFALAFFSIVAFVHFYRSYLSNGGKKSLLLSASSLVISLGSYQAFLPIIIMIAGWRLLLDGRRFQLKLIFVTFFPVVFGIIIYVLIYKITKNIGGSGSDPRVNILKMEDMIYRIEDIFYTSYIMLFKRIFIVSKLISIGLTIVMLLSLSAVWYISRRNALCTLVGIIISLFVIMLPIALLEKWDPTTRNLSSYPFMVGVVFAVFLTCTRDFNNASAKIVIFLASTIVVASVLINEAFYIQVERQNNRNTRILFDVAIGLEKASDNIREVRVAYSGQGEMRTSWWALRGIVYDAIGNKYQIEESGDEDKKQCSGAPKWPHDGYMIFKRDVALVCMN